MNRNFCLAALLSVCALCTALPALAAGLTVTDAEAGYTLTLPEGWEMLSDAYFGERKTKMLRMVPQGQRERAAPTVKVMGKPGAGEGVYATEMVVFYYDKKAIDFGMSIPSGAMMPTQGERELFAMLLAEEAMTKKGAQRSASSVLRDGLRFMLFWKNDKGENAATVWDLRFTPKYMITAVASGHPMTDEAELVKALSGLHIGPVREK